MNKHVVLNTVSLELAQRIAAEVWEKYRDQFGYFDEKIERNASIKTNHPDNIWAFWGQFDSNNQEEFAEKVSQAAKMKVPGAELLKEWIDVEIGRLRVARAELNKIGIDV